VLQRIGLCFLLASAVVWATLVGWILYRHFPDAFAIAGMTVIAASGLFIALHERRRARLSTTQVIGGAT
jgi:drug/metabolite transporter (DMT)-like permease